MERLGRRITRYETNSRKAVNPFLCPQFFRLVRDTRIPAALGAAVHHEAIMKLPDEDYRWKIAEASYPGVVQFFCILLRNLMPRLTRTDKPEKRRR